MKIDGDSVVTGKHLKTENSISFSLTTGICSACGKEFERKTSEWADRCPDCNHCPECESGFIVSYKLVGEHITSTRCLTCLHFWKTDDRTKDDR